MSTAFDSLVANQTNRARLLPRRIEFVAAVSPQASFAPPSSRYKPLNPSKVQNDQINQKDTAERSTAKESAPKRNGSQKSDSSLDPATQPLPSSSAPPSPHIPQLLVPATWEDNIPVSCGLQNLGNTCFMNATLQCLLATPALYYLMSGERHEKVCKQSGWCAYCAMSKVSKVVHAQLNEQRRRSYSPNVIAQNLTRLSRTLHLGHQEDAHEFLRFLVSAMQSNTPLCIAETKQMKPCSNTDEIFAIFGGYLRGEVKCKRCNNTSYKYDAMMDVMLELPPGSTTLKQCFDHSSATELLQGDNAYACEKCKTKTPALKSVKVHAPPRVLCILLKRFTQKFEGRGMRHVRNGTKISYESTLILAGAKYSLYGVLVHSGASMASGHYYAYIKDPNNQWWNMDDSSTRKVTESEALSQTAYVLFYQRIEDFKKPPQIDESLKRKRDESEVNNAEPENAEAGRESKKARKESNLASETDDPMEVNPALDSAPDVIHSEEKKQGNHQSGRKRNSLRGFRVVEALQANSKAGLFGSEILSGWEDAEVAGEKQKQQQLLQAQRRAETNAILEKRQNKEYDRELDKGRLKKVKKNKFSKRDGSNPFNAFAQRQNNQ